MLVVRVGLVLTVVLFAKKKERRSKREGRGKKKMGTFSTIHHTDGPAQVFGALEA